MLRFHLPLIEPDVRLSRIRLCFRICIQHVLRDPLAVGISPAAYIGTRRSRDDHSYMVPNGSTGRESAIIRRSDSCVRSAAGRASWGAVADGNSELMLVAAQLRYMAATRWDTRKNLDMRRLASTAAKKRLKSTRHVMETLLYAIVVLADAPARDLGTVSRAAPPT